MKICHLDFETRSQLDIKKVGARIYAEHESTDILCVAYCVDDGPVRLITRGELNGSPLLLLRLSKDTPPSAVNELRQLAEDPDVIFAAHNAAFEQAIWENIMVKRYGYPPLPIARWKCTMAKAYAHGLPGALERCAAALESPFPKDMEGNKVMQKLSKPRARGAQKGEFYEYEDCPEDFEKLYAYCARDVEAERWIDKTLRDLSPYEQRVWEIDQRMNQRGIYVDLELIESAIEIADKHVGHLAERLRGITGGAVSSPSKRAEMQLWLLRNGVEISNTQAATVTELRQRNDLPPVVVEGLSVFAEANKTSVAKYDAFIQRSSAGVLRETLQYSGAHTRRWTGRGVQIQNMARPNGFGVELCARLAKSLDYPGFAILYDNVLDALSRMSRGAIIARPGKTLVGGDFSQIESRVNAWLAGDTDKLQLFIDGVDVYCKIASDIFGYPVNKKDHAYERQVGKVADLAFGYQGGIAAGAKFARGYNLDFSPIARDTWLSATASERELADYCYMLYLKGKPEEPVSQSIGRTIDIIKQRYRAAHPAIVQLWNDLELTAIHAVKTGQPVQCGKVRWFTHDRYLWCRLPSGGVLCYPYPKVETGSRGKETLTYKMEDKFAGNKWVRRSTYGGALCENLVQAISRDLLVHCMVEMEDEFPVAWHVHDELVSEVDEDKADKEKYEQYMLSLPDWAVGIPIAVETWAGKRYGVK